MATGSVRCLGLKLTAMLLLRSRTPSRIPPASKNHVCHLTNGLTSLTCRQIPRRDARRESADSTGDRGHLYPQQTTDDEVTVITLNLPLLSNSSNTLGPARPQAARRSNSSAHPSSILADHGPVHPPTRPPRYRTPVERGQALQEAPSRDHVVAHT